MTTHTYRGKVLVCKFNRTHRDTRNNEVGTMWFETLQGYLVADANAPTFDDAFIDDIAYEHVKDCFHQFADNATPEQYVLVGSEEN
jgi:hypothetical protein